MFTELTANILYLSVCLCIRRCMYRPWEERQAWSGGLGAVSCVFFFFPCFPLHIQSSLRSSCCWKRSRVVLHGTFSPLARRRWRLRRSQMFWGCKIKKKKKRNVCMPACLYVEGFLFHRVTITQRLLCFSC